MEILGVLILLMLASVIVGKSNWKNKSNIYIAAAIIALLQVLFVVYKMMTMKLPFK